MVDRHSGIEGYRSAWLGLAASMAAAKGWHQIQVNAGVFALAAYLPQRVKRGERLTVYIEGDGLHWISASRPCSPR